MPNTHVLILVAAAALALPDIRVHAQPAGYDIACSIQASSGFRACDEPPPERSCDAAADYASQPSRDATDMTFVNRGDKPVKLYWLNFKGERVLYQNLPPGARQVQQTFVGHNWLVTTSSDQCLGIFETAPPSNIGDGAVTVAPPEIPMDEQPPPPAENVVWTPGYWAWNEDVSDYYWVSGTWTDAPIVGYLWTPGYWVAQRGVFAWRAGYWGPHVGFYGGVNYGYGYFGRGFVAGSWRDGRMMYNNAVTNASITRVSYSGGGTSARPNAAELAAATEYHTPPTATQLQQLHMAHSNPAMRASLNNGHPSIGAASPAGQTVNASAPPAHQGGTLSFTHYTPPPHPARGVDTAAQPRVSQPPAHAQPPARVQPQAPVAQAPAEKQSAQEDRQPHQTPSQTHPRTVPHAEGHSP
jgi:VHL beta domain/WXXGXW repeat (2 copies)